MHISGRFLSLWAVDTSVDNSVGLFIMPASDLPTLWQTVLADLQIDVSETVFKSILNLTTPLKKEGRILEIACPTLFNKERLEERYYGQIQRVLEKVTGERYELVFVVQSPLKTLSPTPLGPLFEKKLATESPGKNPAVGLSPRYTLETFIVGSSNNLAYAVAQGVIKDLGKIHNPFLVYADVGLGKTHLIQAVGNALLKEKPTTKVVYCTSEDFTNELIAAVQTKKTALFKNKFRTTDVLIVDDIQFFAGKDSIQEEFFHTFNALYHEQKQIVLSSDRPPKEIPKLEARLSSRFSCGMMADIQPPDYSTRVAILRSKRDHFRFAVSDDILDIIAQYVTRNIRELEGALKQIVTVALSENRAVDQELADAVLTKNYAASAERKIAPEKILEAVCTYYNANNKDLVSPNRRKEIVGPRQIAMYLLRQLTETPLIQVGILLGGRDHTTILHGVKKIENEVRQNGKVKQDVINIRQSLGLK